MNRIGRTAMYRRITIFVFLFGLSVIWASWAHAATLFVTPSSGQFGVGQVFNVVVRVNSQGKAVNASEGVLSFNPAQLQVQSISSTGSIFNLNVQEPEFSNTAGTVRWTGVILNPGYTGASGNLITVRFKGLVQGATSVKYNSGAVLANDGAGTNVLSGLSGGTYTIGPVTQPPVLPDTGSPDGSAPVVTSPTHPDSAAWYNNNDPVFRWLLPTGAVETSFLVDAKPTSIPDNVSDGAVSEVTYSNVPEGAAYFHVKFRNGSLWGPVTHFPFNTDTIAPDEFAITRQDDGDPKNPRPLLTFGTTDGGSGIQKYVVRIGDADPIDVPETSDTVQFAMPVQLPGKKSVVVEALDRAGNIANALHEVMVEPLSPVVILEYPSSVKRDELFAVTGTSDPLVSVQVEIVRIRGLFDRALQEEEPALVVVTTSDDSGRWTTTISIPESSRYRLQATAVDERGASSYPSEPVFVDVGFNIFGRIVSFIRGLFEGNGWFPWLMRLLVLLLLMMAVSALAHDGDWQFWYLWTRLPFTERREVSKLEVLARDIDEELEILAKVSRHRLLYPGEKYLKSKLHECRKTIKALLHNPHSRLAKRE